MVSGIRITGSRLGNVTDIAEITLVLTPKLAT